MGNPSTNAKRKYNEKSYDRVGLMLPKGMGEKWRSEAKERGLSVNAMIIEAVKWYLENWSNREETDQK